MAALAVGALQAHGATHIRIANRTHGRGEALASKFHVVAEQWDDLPALTNDSDAVIVATSSPTPVIHAADIGSRVDRLQLVDLSVPRNIEEGCRNIAGVTLHDVDGLQQVVESHRIQRQREASRVEELLEQELAEYLDWVHSRAVTPLIADLRRQANAIVEAEVDLTLRRLPQLDAQAQAVVAQMAHRIVGKLLHSPTVALKSRDSAAQFAQAVRQLFGLAACDEETGHRAGQPVRGGRDA
jgi:glutamyl-tRNA reductase